MNPRVALALKLLCGGALLAVLFFLVDREALQTVLSQLNYWVLVSLPVFYLYTGVRALRWQCILRAQGVHLPFALANRLYLSGTFLGLISPGRVGEVYRAWGLLRERKVNAGLGIASVLIDRLSDIAVLFPVGCAGWLYLLQQGYGDIRGAFVVPPFLSPAQIAGKRFLRTQFKRIMRHMPAAVANELPTAYRHFVTSLRSMSVGLVVQITLLTLVAIFIYSAHLYFIAQVLGLPLSFLEVVGVLAASAFINMLPISLNGLGTRDAFLVATLPFLGVERPAAFGFALVFLLLFVANTLMAFPFWLYGKRHTGEATSSAA